MCLKNQIKEIKNMSHLALYLSIFSLAISFFCAWESRRIRDSIIEKCKELRG